MTIKTRCGSYYVRFSNIEDCFARLPSDRYVITDENVARIYRRAVEGECSIVVPAGEKSKSLSIVEHCLEALAEKGATRKSSVIAFGGGVIGDLAGLVAALYMRGVSYIQIPTTLLAQVDSSVGGKVAVDLQAGKNLAGAFYPPAEVLIPLDALSSLDGRQFNNGMAEVWKYAFIADPSLIDTLQKGSLAASGNDENLRVIIERCIEIKKDIVEQDEMERSGVRATLNFGHTVGHAIEAALGYERILHGEAISAGMVAEARLGEDLGVTQVGTANTVAECLQLQGLPTHLAPSIDRSELVSYMLRDKKRASTGLAFSLLTRIGECKLMDGVAKSNVEKVLNQL